MAIRLGAFYFIFFSAVGAMAPYWTLYLGDRGLSATAIGALVALMTVTKVIAPNFWGWLADVSLGRTWTIRISAVLALVAFAGLFMPGGIIWLVLVVALYGFFSQGVLPQFEALTLGHLGSGTARYARIRIWGSVGFIVAVVVAGWILERTGPGWVPVLVWPLLALVAVSCFTVRASQRDEPCATQCEPGPPMDRLAIGGFLLACLLMQLSHAPFYVFFTIHLDELGYGRGLIGQLWALGVIAEIGAFWAMAALTARFGLRALFLFCFVAGALRWTIVAELADDLIWLAISQILHAATFGIYHAAAVQLVHRLFAPAYRGRGQGLYSSIGFGLGGGLGSLLTGFAWEICGPYFTWMSAAVVSVLGMLVVWLLVREPPPRQRVTADERRTV